MNTRKILVLTAGLLVLLAIPQGALASGNESVNESEFDTEPPEGDDSYLEDDDPWSEPSGNDTSTTDGGSDTQTSDDGSSTSSNETADGNATTLDESEFDTSLPPADESFLDVSWLEGEDAPAADTDESRKADTGKTTPSGRSVPTVAPLLGALGIALVAAARRR